MKLLTATNLALGLGLGLMGSFCQATPFGLVGRDTALDSATANSGSLPSLQYLHSTDLYAFSRAGLRQCPCGKQRDR